MSRPRCGWLLIAILAALATPAVADHLEVRRSATLKTQPDRDAEIRARPEIGALLELLNDGAQRNGYYRARIPSGAEGWIYRTLVRRHLGPVPPLEDGHETGGTDTGDADTGILICSFNVQFIGMSTRRDDAAVASVLDPCDVAVVQELLAPPFAGTFPDGSPFRPDEQATEFFLEMQELGFQFVLSEEDTGTNDRNHLNSSATEWWVAFFRPERVEVANDLPGGFLAADRTNHDDYERVPYAFPFRSADGFLDFVLISVHLQPDSGAAARARRAHEINSIATWISSQAGTEADYIILGDMNIENCRELEAALPDGFGALNANCLQTNTNQREGSDRPYDQVLYPRMATEDEIDPDHRFRVIDLIAEMRDDWERNGDGTDYPGDPYDHNRFRAFYSDHHPIAFRMRAATDDD